MGESGDGLPAPAGVGANGSIGAGSGAQPGAALSFMPYLSYTSAAAGTHAPGAAPGATRLHVVTQPLSSAGTEAHHALSPHERLRLFVALGLTAVYLGLLVVMISLSGSSPDLGFSTGSTVNGKQQIQWVVPYGISYDRGVRAGDVLVSESRVGKVRTAVVEIGGDPNNLVTVSTQGFESPGAMQHWSYILLGLIFIGVGGPVFVKARQRTAASAFYAFCVASALCLAVAPNTYLGFGWLLGLMFSVVVLWAGAFAFFFLKFPVRVGRTRHRHNAVVFLVLTSGIVVLITYFAAFYFNPDLYSVAQLLVYSYLAACFAAGMTNIGKSLLTEHSPDVRQQMAIVLGGTALAVGPSILFGVIPALFKLPHINIELTALLLGIMPVSFAYAITQHQLLGVRSFVRRGVVYVLMGFGVLLAFSVALSALSAVLPDGWQNDELGLIGFSIFVFLIALSYGYVQKYVERMVDKYIYHDAYDYKETLLQFSAQLAAEQNLHTLADELVERTCRIMNLTCGVLLLSALPSKDDGTAQHASADDLELELAGGDSATHWSSLRSAHQTGSLNTSSLMAGDPVDAASVATDDGMRVVPYARFGECAEWLLDGLQYELSQLGVRLDDADAPMQLIYFNNHNEIIPTDTGALSTRLLTESRLGETDRQVTASQGLNELVISNSAGAVPASASANGGTSGLAVADSHTEVATARPVGDPQQFAPRRDLEGVRSFLGVPLWTRSRFVGVLCLGGKRTGERFTRDDLSLLSTLGSQAALAIYNAQLYEAREQALLETIAALAHAIEAKDGYTRHHCETMTGRAVALAQTMGLPAREVESVRMGAILHDIGKIGIPDAVLNKPGRLSVDEYELMKQHAEIGARIVQSVGALKDVVPIVRYHQERWDGSGYPEGLKGDSIPLGARIIGVVDTYGAMTEDRIYRQTPGHQKALEELQKLSGRQFDAQVVRAFLQLLEERPDLAELRTGPHAVQ